MTAKGSLTAFFALAAVFVAKDFRLETIGLIDEDIVSLRPLAAILTVVAISLFGSLVAKKGKSRESSILLLSSLGFAVSLSMIILLKTAFALLGAIILSEIAAAFIAIMIIEKRQNLFPKEKRENFTAIMSTSAPFSYILGGGFMGILEKEIFALDTLILMALVIMASSLIFVVKRDEETKEESPREALSKAS